MSSQKMKIDITNYVTNEFKMQIAISFSTPTAANLREECEETLQIHNMDDLRYSIFTSLNTSYVPNILICNKLLLQEISLGFSLCGEVACGLLHDRLSHPEGAFLDLKGTTTESVCHHSKPQSPVKPSSSLPMTDFLSCRAYLQSWDKNSYDLRHLQESMTQSKKSSFSLCGEVACGLLHDRLSHPEEAFLDLKGTTTESVCHHSKPQSPVKPSSSLPMTDFLSCRAYLQSWDKNSYDLRHLQESMTQSKKSKKRKEEKLFGKEEKLFFNYIS
ncbi:hypothetical protein G5I_06070 [Acromyrmex echinatior]|uniref:Uncharacterized protein n=1 Tax=Acromyrmex echinatior TaxID=103372 RepID=F4WK27_ACREC|nr:hypothetical protein G5I_06070 [Acromyrmex echinatior]